MTRKLIAIVGAGGWGTALAKTACESGHRARIWCREESVRDQIRTDRENRAFLSGITLPGDIEATSDLSEALADADIVVFVVPSHFLSGVVGKASSFIPPEAIIACASKGIEADSLRLMSDVVSDASTGANVVLSGPSFAREVALGRPTAIVAASGDLEVAREVQHALSHETFQLFVSDDVVGVELGGALKNVIALAAGMAQGAGLGANAIAALMTRGLMEISHLAEAMGGRRETLLGLAGMGDLVLTCTGELSRNRGVGIRLGQGEPIDSILASMTMVAEGVETTGAAIALGERHRVPMPIAGQVGRVLAGASAGAALLELFASIQDR